MPRGRPRKKFTPETTSEDFIPDGGFDPKGVVPIGATAEDTEETNGVEVEDLSSVEIISQLESIEKRHMRIGNEKYEVLIFPRVELAKRFEDRSGMLRLPKVTASDWFKKTLDMYGFNSGYRFRRDEQGRYLLPIPDEDSYGVWQRI